MDIERRQQKDRTLAGVVGNIIVPAVPDQEIWVWSFQWSYPRKPTPTPAQLNDDSGGVLAIQLQMSLEFGEAIGEPWLIVPVFLGLQIDNAASGQPVFTNITWSYVTPT